MFVSNEFFRSERNRTMKSGSGVNGHNLFNDDDDVVLGSRASLQNYTLLSTTMVAVLGHCSQLAAAAAVSAGLC